MFLEPQRIKDSDGPKGLGTVACCTGAADIFCSVIKGYVGRPKP